MKLAILGALIIAIALVGGVFAQAEDSESSVFRHVVCFKFKDDASESEIKEIETAFASLKDKIDAIIDFEWGTSENIEPLNDEFTHCFIVTFKDKAGLKAYLPHPDHKKFVTLLKPKLDKVFVIDYNVK